jgi:hypothetical protein
MGYRNTWRNSSGAPRRDRYRQDTSADQEPPGIAGFSGTSRDMAGSARPCRPVALGRFSLRIIRQFGPRQVVERRRQVSAGLVAVSAWDGVWTGMTICPDPRDAGYRYPAETAALPPITVPPAPRPSRRGPRPLARRWPRNHGISRPSTPAPYLTQPRSQQVDGAASALSRRHSISLIASSCCRLRARATAPERRACAPRPAG